MLIDTFGEWNTSRSIITDEEMQDPVFIAALQAYIAAVYSKFAGKDDPLDDDFADEDHMSGQGRGHFPAPTSP